MMRKKLALQITVAIAGLVPVLAGGAGVVLGTAMLTDAADSLAPDSHFRYLSGILLAIGLVFWASIPKIETHTQRFQLLTLLVFIGGLARLLGVFINGWPSAGMCFGLGMELVVTPLLCFWQLHVAQKYGKMAAAL